MEERSKKEVTIPEAIDILLEREPWSFEICIASRKIIINFDHKGKDILKIDVSFIDNIDAAVNTLKKLTSLTMYYYPHDFEYVVFDIKSETVIKFLEDIRKEKE